MSDNLGVKLTCNKCQVGLSTRAEAVEHYSSKWHEQNVMEAYHGRPLRTLENFNKLLNKIKETEEMESSVNQGANCSVCKKYFYTHGAYEMHVRSRKHKVNVTRKLSGHKHHQLQQQLQQQREQCSVDDPSEDVYGIPKEDCEIKCEDGEDNQCDFSDGEMVDVEDSWVDVSESEDDVADDDVTNACLFCDNQSESLPDNMTHMHVYHGFSVALSQVTHVAGLLQYLAREVLDEHSCITCGREFDSMAACRAHMADKRHVMVQSSDIRYTEYFTEAAPTLPLPAPSSDVYAVHLPGGREITHRGFARYTTQKLSRDPVTYTELVKQRKNTSSSAGWSQKSMGYYGKLSALSAPCTGVYQQQQQLTDGSDADVADGDVADTGTDYAATTTTTTVDADVTTATAESIAVDAVNTTTAAAAAESIADDASTAAVDAKNTAVTAAAAAKTAAVAAKAAALKREMKRHTHAAAAQQSVQFKNRLRIGVRANHLQTHFRLQYGNAG